MSEWRVLMMQHMFVEKHDMLHSVITYGLNPELLFGEVHQTYDALSNRQLTPPAVLQVGVRADLLHHVTTLSISHDVYESRRRWM